MTWLWCFPQQLLGWVVKIVTHARKNGDYYTYNIKCGSMSLGTYVFICPAHVGSETVLKHEQGHTKQSYILGWLWLPLVGIPSLIWAGCFGWLRAKYKISYYAFYTEAWADRLGGVKR